MALQEAQFHSLASSLATADAIGELSLQISLASAAAFRGQSPSLSIYITMVHDKQYCNVIVFLFD